MVSICTEREQNRRNFSRLHGTMQDFVVEIGTLVTHNESDISETNEKVVSSTNHQTSLSDIQSDIKTLRRNIFDRMRSEVDAVI